MGLGPNKGTWGGALDRLVALWEPLPGPHAVLRAAFSGVFTGVTASRVRLRSAATICTGSGGAATFLYI